MIRQFTVETTRRSEFIDITARVEEAVRGLEEGVATIFVPHTTAGVTINENADPSVARDILRKLGDLIPQRDHYDHAEGNSDAHLKASLIGPSLQVIVKDGRLLLGTWQGIYFCEFDGPRTRKCVVRV